MSLGTEKIVELLIKKGVDVNAMDKIYGRSPLHYALLGCTLL